MDEAYIIHDELKGMFSYNDIYNMDWKEYEICVRWCLEEGIYTIADLLDRVISHQDYKKLWYERCAKMQKDLEEKRRTKNDMHE